MQYFKFLINFTIKMKQSTIIIIAITLALLISTLFLGRYMINKAQLAYIDQLEQYKKDSEQELRKWRDADSLSNASKRVAELDIKTLLLANKQLVEELKSQLDRDFKGLQNVTKVQLETLGDKKGSLTDSLIITNVINRPPDTVIAQKFNMTDSWISLKGLILHDSISVKYRIKEDLSVVAYQAHEKGFKGWFKPSKLTVIVKSKNPNSEITGLESLSIKPAPKKWYQTKGFAFGMGVAVGIIGITGTGIALRR